MTLKWNGQQVKENLIEAFITGSAMTAEEIFTTSQNSVPRDTGTLGNSGCVTYNKLPNPLTTYNEAKVKAVDSDLGYSPDIKTIYISYNTPYANKQHEDLQLHHPNGGQAKFLEKAINSHGKPNDFRRNIIKAAKMLGLR